MTTTTPGTILKTIDFENEELTVIRLAGGGLMAVDASYLASDAGHVYSSVDEGTIVTGEGLDYESEDASLVDDLLIAQSLTIDGDSIRSFNVFKNGDDDDVYLDASQFQFTKVQIESAIKDNLVWKITNEETDEEYELTCEKVTAF